MAHFVRLDKNNIVVETIVVSNSVILDKNGQENEQLGIQWLKNFRGGQGTWRKTSYSGKEREKFAGIGYKYDTINDIYTPPKPFDSFVWDKTIKNWKPPVALGKDLKPEEYEWDEFNKTWKKIKE
tara:strand:- start:6336 stop:6710 length:375 start_codon:yes stop_codon:yes gene_type:complete